MLTNKDNPVVTMRLHLQDITNIDQALCYASVALNGDVIRLKELAEKFSDSNYFAQELNDAQVRFEDFDKARSKLLGAFCDGTYNAGIHPFDW